MERILIFGLRLLACALIAWPVAADEPQSLFAPEALTAEESPASAKDNQLFIPAEVPLPIPAIGSPTQVAALPDEAPLLPFPESPPTQGNHYWMVSSRNSVQTIHEASRGAWGLHVYQRFCDGQMINSDMATLTSQLNPNLPVCIFIHGSFVKWESQCQESHAFYQQLAACSNGSFQLIFFTWPSDGPRTHLFPVDVAVRERRADFNGFHLGYLLTQIPESSPVTLIGHSHGGRLLLSTMHLAGGGTIEGHYFPYSMGQNRRFRAVLAAGALDHNSLNPNRSYGCALNRLECLLNLQNRSDRALAFYPLSRPFAHRAIARTGITGRDSRQLGPNAAKIRDVDITNTVGPSHYWPSYYSQPGVIATILPYLYY
ncbi:MAG TPA: alpha/beta hydrolase [Planctomicrobium sp.]|nr:alpha/beta hydrolase [Planctomicrobium sp.]